MPTYSTSRQVGHSAADMFDLVADIEAYPAFVPLCAAMHIRSREQENGKEVLVATMTVAYKFLRETFTSRVTLDRKALSIRAVYLDGPFRHLDNVWRFEPAGGSRSTVHFAIDYEFRSRTLAMLMGTVFDRAVRMFADAFEKRADAVYGRDG